MNIGDIKLSIYRLVPTLGIYGVHLKIFLLFLFL